MKLLRIIGWREWLALPDIGIGRVKAKVDTGARSSSLHAFDVELVKRGRVTLVRFNVHPIQRDSRTVVHCEAPLREHRYVRSSSGVRQYRPVIRTTLQLGQESWAIDITLTSRDVMGFRMLLGREAMRGRQIIDPGRSFLVRDLVPRRKKKKKMRKKLKKQTRTRSSASHRPLRRKKRSAEKRRAR